MKPDCAGVSSGQYTQMKNSKMAKTGNPPGPRETAQQGQREHGGQRPGDAGRPQLEHAGRDHKGQRPLHNHREMVGRRVEAR